jgi:hypothetical protein
MIGKATEQIGETSSVNSLRPSWWKLVIVLPWVIGLIFSCAYWKADLSIAKRERATSGVIVAHDKPNHSRYGYTYVVNQKTYHGWEIPHTVDFEIGQNVVVYYDPNNPSDSSLTEFAEASERQIAIVPILLIGISGVALAILLLRRRQTKLKLTHRRPHTSHG